MRRFFVEKGLTEVSSSEIYGGQAGAYEVYGRLLLFFTLAQYVYPKPPLQFSHVVV